MRVTLLTTILLAACFGACGGDQSKARPPVPGSGESAAAAARVDSARAATRPAPETAAAAAADTTPPLPTATPPRRPTPVRHLATPDPVRGLYVNRSVAQAPEVWRLIALAHRTRVNALVFDVKDANGLVLYPSTVGLAHAIGADTVHAMPVRRLHALMDSLRKYRIYPVARIVVGRDPVLAAHRPQWAVVPRPRDPERSAWLDPRHREVWAYAADLASEAAARGFSEVQFADVRFPTSDGESQRVELTSPDGRTLGEVIRAQLGFLRSRISVLEVPMAITVSGLAGVDSSDLGVGQRWEAFIDRADIVVPMEYPSLFPAGTFGLRDPNAAPYETVKRALAGAERRSAAIAGAARIVPWYQDFSRGDPAYGELQVRAQMRAGADAGIHSWMLWNPASSYTEAALQAPARLDSAKKTRVNVPSGGRSRR
jgi:hypothetical protein